MSRPALQDARADIHFIAHLTLFTSLLSLVLVAVLTRLIPPFDSSHLLVSTFPTLRWDAIHFLGVARNGYIYEQQLAFQPGWHALMRAAGEAVAFLRRREVTDWDILAGTTVVNICARVAGNVVLYKLTCTLFSRRMARATCILYALPPTPAVLISPYTEPLFALLYFSGSYAAIKRKYLVSALLFAAGTSLRATGVLGAAVLGWMLLVANQRDAIRPGEWSRPLRRLPGAIALAALVASPFVAFQYYAYKSLCPGRPWCTSKLPMVYGFVQKEYWNIGPFEYWTFAQLPNFAIAAPVVVFSLYGVGTYLSACVRSLRRGNLDFAIAPATAFYLHHAGMLALLLIGSHTQIALRLAVTEPVVWWTVARSVCGESSQEMENLQAKTPLHPRMGTMAKVWIAWAVVWGAISLVLWAGFYPPA